MNYNYQEIINRFCKCFNLKIKYCSKFDKSNEIINKNDSIIFSSTKVTGNMYEKDIGYYKNNVVYNFYFGNDKRHLFKKLFEDMRGRKFRVNKNDYSYELDFEFLFPNTYEKLDIELSLRGF